MNEREELPRLLGVPQAEVDESPSSWLARAALSHGTSMHALLDFLNLPDPGELDFFVLSNRMPTAFHAVGLGIDALPAAGQILSNLRKLDSDGRKYLLRSKDKIRYRYCAPCLLEQREKYLPIHWRFKAWQWCPWHSSVMRDGCSNCNAPIVLPASLERAGSKREGVGSLDYCLKCGHRLASTAQADRMQVRPETSDPWTRFLMINGRALLAALHRGHLFVPTDEKQRPIESLRRLSGLIPNNITIWESEAPVDMRTGG